MKQIAIFTSCLLLLGALAINAQELSTFRGQNGKYGFSDKSGKEIVPPKYDRAYAFSEGMARVQLNRKWGFIDESGKEIINDPILGFKYDFVYDFSEGLAAVKRMVFDLPLWGYIDKTGKEVTRITYKEANSFSDGYALIRDAIGIYNYVDKNFNNLIKHRTEGTMDFDKFIVPERILSAKSFREGLAAVKLISLTEPDKDKWGFINTNGEIAIKAEYDFVNSFSEGLAAVNKGGTTKEGLAGIEIVEGGSWGFIDKTGRQVLPFEFDNAYYFNDGKALVQRDGRQFYIDRKGREVIDEKTALQELATAYQTGKLNEAFRLATVLADRGNAEAMNLLGNMHAQGQGTNQNFFMARSWWEMAAARNNAAATGNIGLLHAQGLGGVTQNIAEAEKWFKKGADLGDPQSMFNLGNLAFQKGNFAEARQWIQKAKTAGHPQSDAALKQIIDAEEKANRMKERN